MSQINHHMFRGNDIRGLAGTELTPASAELIGKAIGTYLLRNGCKKREAIVGQDCRLSSPELSTALIAGLRSTGINVKDIGLASWGFVNYALRQEAGNAVFVSASHNPPEYNG
ncbi:MAG: phosphomannomutase/phosphoglucomutase, partial [Candidatus Micrarchaeota archaeon]